MACPPWRAETPGVGLARRRSPRRPKAGSKFSKRKQNKNETKLFPIGSGFRMRFTGVVANFFATLSTRTKATLIQSRWGLKSLVLSVIIWAVSTVAEIKSAAGGLVVSNPAILGGTPVFGGTRPPVQTLFDYLADGLTLGYFLETFEGVTREQARAVLCHGWDRIVAELAE